MLKAMYDNNVNITTLEDANMYNVFAGERDFVIKGYAQDLECIIEEYLVTLSMGMCLVQGRHIHENGYDGLTTVTIPQDSTSGYIVIRYDISQPAGLEAQLRVVATPRYDDLRNNGIIRDIVLYSFTNVLGTVTLNDLRKYSNGSGGSSTITLLSSGWIGTSAPFTQTVSVSGIQESSNVIPDVMLSGSIEQQLAQIAAFGLVSKGTPHEGAISFVCLENKPTIDLDVALLIFGGV